MALPSPLLFEYSRTTVRVSRTATLNAKLDQCFLLTSLTNRDYIRDKGRLLDYPEYVLALEVPKGLLSFMTVSLKVEVFHISPASLEALKVAATPVVKTERHTNEPFGSLQTTPSRL